MKIVVLGARGQLGQELCAILPGEVVPLGRAEADLAAPASLAALVPLRPDVVVNCAAYNLVDRAEDEPDVAFTVNAFGVRALAQVCRDLGCRLVHFSTDHVFGLDADRRMPIAETDAAGPVSAYGASKLAGEHFVRSICPRHLVIRTCGLYGKRGQGGKGGNFVETMLKRAADGAPLRVVDDQRCTPTAAADLAHATAALIAAGAEGLLHVTNGGDCTWFEFTQAILELSGRATSLTAISSEHLGAKARRPAYSVLDCAAYHKLGLPLLRPWREALAAYLAVRQ